MIEELLLISNTLKLVIYLLYSFFKKTLLPRTDKEDIPAQSLSGLGRGDSGEDWAACGVYGTMGWGGVGWGRSLDALHVV
jgi:hypothetical protein